jgi:acetyl esterase/lipase
MYRHPVPAWASGLLLLLVFLAPPAQAFSLFKIFGVGASRELTVTYTSPDWPAPLKGDLYLPEAKAAAPYPVVLVLHGGAWRRGDRGNMKRLGQVLAERGYAAFAIDYRLAPQFRHPAQLEDMQQALRWLQQHAEEQRLDMARVAAWGYSAGGHLAALLAVQKPVEGLPPLRAVIAGGTPADLRRYPDASSVKGFLGGPLAAMPEVYAAASPLAQVRAGLPPFFLYHGSADDLVEAGQSEQFAEALKAAGVPVELHLLEGANHRTAAGRARQLLPAALQFLGQHVTADERPPAAETARNEQPDKVGH